MIGIAVIDKPQGMTSHDVVSFLRRKTGIKRIGHSGTLDPMATGVLPVFIGKATRVIEYSGKPDDTEAKLYSCTMKLGIETDTQDIWGTILRQSNEIPQFSTIERVLKSFEGPGTQKPPMYSAVKVEGRKLYEYARKGTAVNEALIKERTIYIKHIDVKFIETNEVSFDVLCSKGVYIRTLCADAGRMLCCGAAMSGLRRLKSNGFSIDMAVRPEDFREADLLPVDWPLEWMPRVETNAEDAEAFSMGRKFNTYDDILPGSHVRVYSKNSFIGIGKKINAAEIKPEKVFN